MNITNGIINFEYLIDFIGIKGSIYRVNMFPIESTSWLNKATTNNNDNPIKYKVCSLDILKKSNLEIWKFDITTKKAKRIIKYSLTPNNSAIKYLAINKTKTSIYFLIKNKITKSRIILPSKISKTNIKR